MMKEVDLAAKVIEYLKADGWEVFQEVKYIKVADIVARKDGFIWVIECKTSMSLKLISQALHWKQFANRISVAVCKYPCDDAMQILNGLNIGCFDTISPSRFRSKCPEPFCISDDSKVTRCNWDKILVEQHKEWCDAGSAGGGYYTPFAQTKLNIMEYVEAHPGCLINDLIANVAHHYERKSTFRSCLIDYARRGIIEVDIRKIDNKNRVFLSE